MSWCWRGVGVLFHALRLTTVFWVVIWSILSFFFSLLPITCSTRRYDGRARDSVTSSATNVSNSGPTSVASNAHDKAVAVVSADSADDFDSCDPPAAAGRRILVCYYCAALLVSYCYVVTPVQDNNLGQAMFCAWVEGFETYKSPSVLYWLVMSLQFILI